MIGTHLSTDISVGWHLLFLFEHLAARLLENPDLLKFLYVKYINLTRLVNKIHLGSNRVRYLVIRVQRGFHLLNDHFPSGFVL